MAKLIFTSRYLRDVPPAQLENYVRYIGTREGVEKIDESKRHLPATVEQKKLIRQIIRDIPETKEMLEYTDFLLRPTMENASEFISCSLERNMDLLAKRENYVDYIANRPRVERVGEHGLFTDLGTPIVLKQVQEQAAAHKGAVWTHVISLRREDAARLGYDSASQWMALLRSKRAMLCKHMKIESQNLKWYAAFHNEGHHPHVHLMVYSSRDHDGYLTKQSIEAMRSELAHDIFRQDFAHIYEEQNQSRAKLKAGAEQVVRELMREIGSGMFVSPAIEERILLLSKRLQNTGGKKVYGYLKRDVKNLVDEIVDELAKDSRVAKLYQAWGKWQNEILLTYRNHVPELPPLSKQPQFKSIRNMVIAEALKLGNGQVTFEDERIPEPQEPESQEEEIGYMEPDVSADTELLAAEEELESEEKELEERAERAAAAGAVSYHASWNERYQSARQYLYGTEDKKPDFECAMALFQQEAVSGNTLAMYDLGRMHADGLGCGSDASVSQEWYEKALEGFQAVERQAKEKKKPYLQYRIGKMYAAGLGTEKDDEKAACWFSKAVTAGHKYAQYSLGSLYYRGKGVSQNYKRAMDLYERSGSQGNPYADYELAKMYRDGIGTGSNRDEADGYFQSAFFGFQSLEKKSHDDKLQYRLGQMLHTGTGKEKNDAEAAAYWEKVAKLGNIYAQYGLGKLWLENGCGNQEQAVRWLTKAAESGNPAAQYTLGKIYRDGEIEEKDIKRAVELFTLAANQGHDFAAYQLGRLYPAGEEMEKEVEKAVRWFSYAAEKGNPYAQYRLGKLYLDGQELPMDLPKAVQWLRMAAEQKHEYALYQLGRLYLSGERMEKNVEMAVPYLEACAGMENQYAQYALGKLYLCGRDVPRDREKAVAYLEASAAQGNEYAQFFWIIWIPFGIHPRFWQLRGCCIVWNSCFRRIIKTELDRRLITSTGNAAAGWRRKNRRRVTGRRIRSLRRLFSKGE